MGNYDSRLPLAVRGPNVLGAMSAGQTMGARENEIKHTNALRDLYQQQGADILKGDPNALGALAGLDPGAAMDIQAQQQNMSIQREKMEMLRAEGQRAAQRLQMQMSAADLEREQGKLKQGIAAAMTAQSPEEWDAIASQFGAEDLVGQFGNRDAIVAFYSGLDSTLDRMKGAKQPTSVQEFEYAQQNGYEGTYNDFLTEKGKSGATNISTTVNTGNQPDARPMADKPPKGYQRRWDPEQQSWVDEPIPGGEKAVEQEQGETKLDLAVADYDRKFNLVDEKLDQAISSLEENGRFVAGYGSYLSGLPETEARNFQATLDTIKANLGFEELQNMRDNSPTGGALGQVSEREIAFLQAMQGNLDSAQSPDQLMQVLREIKERRAQFRSERERIMGREPSPSQPLTEEPTGFQFQSDEQKRVFEKYSRP